MDLIFCEVVIHYIRTGELNSVPSTLVKLEDKLLQ